MTQVEDQAGQAEERSEETRSFVRQVRAVTRRKYTPEEKIRIVLEGFRRETTVNDLCRRGRNQTPLLLRLDQGVHGSWEGEVDSGQCA